MIIIWILYVVVNWVIYRGWKLWFEYLCYPLLMMTDMLFIHTKAGTLHGLMYAWYFMFLFIAVVVTVIFNAISLLWLGFMIDDISSSSSSKKQS